MRNTGWDIGEEGFRWIGPFHPLHGFVKQYIGTVALVLGHLTIQIERRVKALELVERPERMIKATIMRFERLAGEPGFIFTEMPLPEHGRLIPSPLHILRQDGDVITQIHAL